MQEILVFIVVLLAAVYIGRTSFKKFKGAQTGSCSCGCTGCSRREDCSDSP